jgi:hypothetical protein
MKFKVKILYSMNKKWSEIWQKQPLKCVSVCECEFESVWEGVILRARDYVC